VCTDPKSHPQKERKETAAEKRTRLEHERLRTEKADREAAQKALHAQILTGKPDKSWDTFFVELLEAILLEDAADSVVEALQLTTEAGDDAHVLVESYVAKSAINRKRATLAAGLAWVSRGYSAGEKAAYERLLTAHGWAAERDS
jgi:hypothetical protein